MMEDSDIFKDLDLNDLTNSKYISNNSYEDMNYIIYGNIWEYMPIEDIGFKLNMKTKIFETKLYFTDTLILDRLYFTRFLKLDELTAVYHILKIPIPTYLDDVISDFFT